MTFRQFLDLWVPLKTTISSYFDVARKYIRKRREEGNSTHIMFSVKENPRTEYDATTGSSTGGFNGATWLQSSGQSNYDSTTNDCDDKIGDWDSTTSDLKGTQGRLWWLYTRLSSPRSGYFWEQSNPISKWTHQEINWILFVAPVWWLFANTCKDTK